jgi:hypothetical protein
MTKIEQVAKFSTSKAFKALNPQLFGSHMVQALEPVKPKPKPKKRRPSYNTTVLLGIFEVAGIPAPTFEYRFHPDRKWKFDLCWVDHKLALEVEGGVWVQGRHSRPSGFVKDMEKYNAAAVLGFRIVRCQPSELVATKTVTMLLKALGLIY